MRFAVLLVAAAGCFVPTTSDTTCTGPDCEPTTGTDRPTDTSFTTPNTAPEAPVVESVKVSAPTITQGESVTVSVVISDVDGLATITGGNVRGPGDEVIAPFVQRGDGEYDIELSWLEIHQAIGIQFEAESLDLGLQIVFFDTGNQTGRAALPLTATCGGGSNYACGGLCLDAGTSFSHCGACDSECGKGEECFAGTCASDWSACERFDTTKHDNCAELCAASGEVCDDRCEGDFAFNTMVRWSEPTCGGGSDYDIDRSRCDDTYTWSTNGSTFASVQCCCTVGAVFTN